MAESRPLVVVKVGGSLLDWPELTVRLETFLGSDVAREGGPHPRFVLIVGGGPVADAIRALDKAQGFGAARAHRLALGAMDLTAELLAGELSGGLLVRSLEELPGAWRAERRPILAVRRYMEEVDEPGGDPLPRSWSVTSDSIAARIADRLGADRLILLKSTATAASSRREAAEAGLVDPVFPKASALLGRVEVVALREPDRPIRTLTS